MTPMSDLAARERHALCDTLEDVGPTAPTLCDPWSTAELAAHLVIRDGRPDLAAGAWIPPLSGRLEAAMERYATKPWAELVHLVRSGPPSWSPTRIPLINQLVNLSEFFIHHEDILRGAGQPGPQRTTHPELDSALWGQLSKSAGLMLRGLDVGVVLVAPGHGRKAVKKPTDRGAVAITGSPGELTVAVSGRLRVADVDVSGPGPAVASARASL